MMFAVVKFTGKQAFAIVPVSWIDENNVVHWPRCLASDRNRMIRRREPHGSNCDLRESTICGIAETYNSAECICAKASSEDSTLMTSRPRRTMKRPARFISTCSDDSSDAADMPILQSSIIVQSEENAERLFRSLTPPAPIRIQRTDCASQTASISTMHDRSALSDSPYNVLHRPAYQGMLNTAVYHGPSTSSQHWDGHCEQAERYRQDLAGVKDDLKLLSDKLDLVLAHIEHDARMRHEADERGQDNLFSLPLQSEDDLLALEVQLGSPERRVQLRHLLLSCGGRSLGEKLRHMFTTIFGARLAQMCNILGVNKKLAIGDKRVLTVIRDAIRSDIRFANVKDSEINCELRSWLHNARFRKSTRVNRVCSQPTCISTELEVDHMESINIQCSSDEVAKRNVETESDQMKT